MPQLSRLYLLAGDSFLVEEKSKTLQAAIRSAVKGEVPTHVYHLSEAGIEKVLTEARSLPFLAQAQIFRVKEADTLKAEEAELLREYLEHPSPSAYLIFEAPSLDRRSVFTQLLERLGEVHALEDREKKSASAQLIREKLKQSGKTMTPQALTRLEAQAGDAPAFLDSIVEQLIIHAGAKTQITEEMVAFFEENWQEVDGFKLTDALANQNTAETLRLLRQLVGDSERDLISLLGLLHWQVRRFWQARVLLEEGRPEGEVLKRCRVYPNQASHFLRQLKRFTRKKLETALEGLFQLDWKLKTGRAEGLSALESWLVQTTT